MDEELIKSAVKEILESKYAIALTGAGLSTESGIPDYRGPNGIWTKNPEAEKMAYRSYKLFAENPQRYWEERLGQTALLGDLSIYSPNQGHYALVELEKLHKLKHIITQNIDSLHLKSGAINLIEYHGNALKLRCLSCSKRYQPGEYDLPKMHQEKTLPPFCKRCGSPLKSDVVHFGEPIPEDVIYNSIKEAQRCDLMLICGTSAAVYPFASLPVEARKRSGVKIIEVNAAPTPLTTEKISDYLIQGKTGTILPRIAELVDQKMEA